MVGYPWLRKLAYRLSKGDRQKIELIRGDNHSEETLLKVLRILNDKELDLLFINRGHSYEEIKRDLRRIYR